MSRVFLAGVFAVGGGVRGIAGRRFVEGESSPECGLLPLVPSFHPPPFLLPAGFPLALLILFDYQLEYHRAYSFCQVDEFFGQIDYAAGHGQAAEGYG